MESSDPNAAAGGVPAIHDLPPIQHRGRRVITTELLAQAYGVDVDAIHDNYRKTEDRFVEGVHFHKLVGAALRSFKSQPESFRLVDKRASHLTLWTERGAARHAKMLNTDEAWSIFEKLESAYFDTPKPEVALAHPPRITSETFKAYFGIGRLIGLDRNQSAIAANNATRKTLGVDALANMGTTHLTAPQQEKLLTPTDIGVELGGKSGMAVNSLLAEHGLQVGKRDAKDRPYWEPTEAGKPYAVWQDTGKRHGDGTPVRQLKWLASVIGALRVELTA